MLRLGVLLLLTNSMACTSLNGGRPGGLIAQGSLNHVWGSHAIMLGLGIAVAGAYGEIYAIGHPELVSERVTDYVRVAGESPTPVSKLVESEQISLPLALGSAIAIAIGIGAMVVGANMIAEGSDQIIDGAGILDRQILARTKTSSAAREPRH